MEKLLAGGGDPADAPAPVPKSTVELPELSTKVSDTINALFSDAGNRLLSCLSRTGSLDTARNSCPRRSLVGTVVRAQPVIPPSPRTAASA